MCNVFQLRSVPNQEDRDSMGAFERYRGILLKLRVTGSAANSVIGTALPTRESFVKDFRPLTQEQVSGRFVIEANPGTRLNRERFRSNSYYRCIKVRFELRLSIARSACREFLLA